MDQYQAPTDDIVDALTSAGLDELLALAAFDAIDQSSITDVIATFGKLASDVIAPTDRVGDREGARFDPQTAAVTVPPELTDAFRHYVDGGWQALAADPAVGGGGFPGVVATAVHEIFGSANMALSLNPMLTSSAIELLDHWASPAQRSTILTRLVDGTWSGTMNLTEPDAGSDLGAVRTTATPTADGSTWRVNGTKIFITWGEHDLSDNIIHLVLARTPGAPTGTKGISLFLVPKRRLDDDGTPTGANGVHCRGIEHKLGIHASPTCTLEFVDAEGALVGPLHGGMAAMFTMMNHARLAVGVQGVSIAERSDQQARTYAVERHQGPSPTTEVARPIIEHPDVERMLLDIASTRDAMRLLTYATAVAGDHARHDDDPTAREQHRRRADLLTPIAKAWPTDQGVRLASLAIQIHGGAGYIEETGIAQRYRDARIAPIYEGTNGIQAIDLVSRKIARDGGLAAHELFDGIEHTIHALTDAASVDPVEHSAGLASIAASLTDSLRDARQATDWVLSTWADDRDAVLYGATEYLELLAVVTAADLLARHAQRLLASAHPTAATALVRAHYFTAAHLTRRPTLRSIAVSRPT